MQTDILDFATDDSFRLKNWQKHLTDERHNSPYPHANEYVELDGQRFTRAMVFAHFQENDAKGVISTIKWGYPKGSLTMGKWQAFSDAFRTKNIVEALNILRKNPRSAPETVRLLNGCVKGIGTATTTKIAYFAGLSSTEGRCLIYDSMVRRTIARGAGDEFSDLSIILNKSLRDLSPQQQEHTYGIYLKAIHVASRNRGVSPETIELEMFKKGRELPPR
ncbi:hypothetical protein WEU32_01065 [Brevundimonas sp. BH3]|uniref:8-oxoguanine DNA glycosylase OGG fold protein n=1 Tax=Brevundimonas sp. BH3 TaxID=3133089 RepID=UPI0032453EB8